MNKPIQKKHPKTPSVNEILASAQLDSTHSLMERCSVTQQLQTVLDSILPHYFGLIKNCSVIVGKVKDGTASLFFSNPSLASQARFVLQPIIPTLQQHYGFKTLRSFKIIAHTAPAQIILPKRRHIQRKYISDRTCSSLMDTAQRESDRMLSDAIARLAYHASSHGND